MTTQQNSRGDVALEKRLGTVLAVGVRASTVCLAAGLLLDLTTSFGSAADGLMLFGLIALIATPIARVAASVLDFGRRRDWVFFVLTLIVLGELCAGIVAALVFHRRL
jgi:uncharacterized membrane protein